MGGLITLPANGIPDFQVFSSGIELLTSANPLFPDIQSTQDGLPTVSMTGSSNIEDLHGDTMDSDALKSMTEFPTGTTLFRNHSYRVPDDVFGKSLAAPKIVQDQNIADLWLVGGVFIQEDGANRTYQLIQQGAKIGISGGFMVLEYSIAGDDDDWYAPIIIHKVLTLEFSTVGIPANQRSWVQNGIKGLFERHVREDNGDEALRLASAYKGLFRNDYRDLVKSMDSQGLRKELERRPTRPNTKNKLYWEPLQKSFIIVRQGGRSETIAPGALNALFKSLQEQEKRMDVKKKDAQGNDIEEETTTPAVPPVAEPATVPPVEETPPPAEETTTTPAVEETPAEPATTVVPAEPATPPSGEISAEPATVTLSAEQQAMYDQWVSMGKAMGFPVETVKSAPLALSADDATTVLKLFTDMVTKASNVDKAYVKVIHDMCKNVAGGGICNPDIQDDMETDSALVQMVKGFTTIASNVATQLEGVSLAIKTVGTAISPMEHVKGLEDLKQLSVVLTKTAASLTEQFKVAQAGVIAVAADVQTLKSMPLGNPKELGRDVREGEATREQLLAVNKVETKKWTLEEALSQTQRTKVKNLLGHDLDVRHWPSGVGGDVETGVRPPLTVSQKCLMVPAEWYAYEDGEEVNVPTIDDPEK